MYKGGLHIKCIECIMGIISPYYARSLRESLWGCIGALPLYLAIGKEQDDTDNSEKITKRKTSLGKIICSGDKHKTENHVW